MDADLRAHVGETFFALVRANFRSGFNPASIVDRKKLARAFDRDGGGGAVELDERTLTPLASQMCLLAEGKYYAIDPEARGHLERLFERLRQQGANVVFMERLFQRHANEFTDLGINALPVLTAYVAREFSDVLVDRRCLLLFTFPDFQDEFRQKLSGRPYLRLTDFDTLFPYVSSDFVQHMAVKTLGYQRLSSDTLILPGAVELDEAEWQREKAKISRAIAEQGYCFYSQLDFSESRAKLGEFLEADFDIIIDSYLNKLKLIRHGQVISDPKQKVRIKDLVSHFCRSQEKFTFEDVKDLFLKYLDPKNVSFLAQISAENSIQVEENKFVSFDVIEFNVVAIDNIIFNVYGESLFTLKSFNKYLLLPAITNYKWNKYILQSFLRHYSKLFNLYTPGPNNKCMGIICTRNFKNKSYHEIVALKALQDNIEPEFNELSDYLVSEGLYATRKAASIKLIIDKMLS